MSMVKLPNNDYELQIKKFTFLMEFKYYASISFSQMGKNN